MTYFALLPAAALGAVLPDYLHPGKFLTVTTHTLSRQAVVFAVSGEVDLFTSPLLRDELTAALRNPIRHLIVDLAGVGFFGAAGISVLSDVRNASMAAGVGLSVVANTRPVLMPLRITGMAELFDIHSDRAHAVLGVGGPKG